MNRREPWRPRLVGVDLDGTLLGTDGTVSPYTVAVVARVEAAGVPVVIVTGRPPRWLGAIAEQLNHRGIAICANGALVWDLRAGRVVAAALLEPALLAEVTSRLRTALPEATFAVEYGDAFTHEAAYPVRWGSDNPVVRSAEPAELLLRPAAKLLLRHPTYDPDHLVAEARALLGETVTVTHSSRDGLLEISAPGVTKATGLARVAASHEIRPADVLAFGDMPNDLPMLFWAGRAVAVANAHPAVIAAADDTTGSNVHHGVATYLERFFPPA